MTTKCLRIEQSGFLTTLQDWGRFGQLAHGVTRGGPIDERAFLWGNKLLGNHAEAAQLEITLGGAEFTALADGYWVVCGSASAVEHNAKTQPCWQVFKVVAGDHIRVHAPRHGLRSYLAVAGGLAGAKVYGSVATVIRDGLGGLQGNGLPLQAGDEINYSGASYPLPVAHRRPRPQYLTNYQETKALSLGVVLIGQYREFSASDRQAFFNQSFQVTAQQDRMGVRLQSAAPLNYQQAAMISEPLPIGAIQIPPDGQPIIMLNDCQTLGGYPKIGVLTWSARCQLGQARAGTEVHFEQQSLAAAQDELAEAYHFFFSTRTALGSP